MMFYVLSDVLSCQNLFYCISFLSLFLLTYELEGDNLITLWISDEDVNLTRKPISTRKLSRQTDISYNCKYQQR